MHEGGEIVRQVGDYGFYQRIRGEKDIWLFSPGITIGITI